MPSAVVFGSCPDDELRVLVEGNKKTKKHVIRRLAGLAGECVPEEGLDAENIRQELLNAHIFTDVEVEVEKEPGVATVKITVKERWTILPIPNFSTGDNETGGGLLLMEANFLGRKKMVMAGAFYSNLSQKYEGLYVDDAFLGSKWIVIARPVYSDREFFRYDDEDEIYAYRRKFSMFFLIVGRRLTDTLAPGLGLKYLYTSTESVDDYPEPPSGGHAHSFLLNLRFNNMDYTDYYDRGINIIAVFEQATPALGSERTVSKTGFEFEMVEPLWKVLTRTHLKTGWTWGEDVDILDKYRMGGEVGARGLVTRGVWLYDFVSFSEEIEERVYRHKYGTLTLVQFMDFLFSSEDEPFRTYPAIGGGLRAYIKQLAIPAVGVDAGYSLRNYAWHVSAHVGKAF